MKWVVGIIFVAVVIVLVVAAFSPAPGIIQVQGAEDQLEEIRTRQKALEIVSGPKLSSVNKIIIGEDPSIADSSKLVQIKTPDGKLITYVGDGEISPIVPRFTPIKQCDGIENKLCHTQTLSDGSIVEYFCDPFSCSCMHKDGENNCF